MITIEQRTKDGIHPGQPSTTVQWIIVAHKNKVIANLQLSDEPWSFIENWATRQIDLYLKQQIGQVNV